MKYQTKLVDNEIILEQQPLSFSHKKYHKAYMYIKGGVGIGKASLQKEKPFKGSEREIIDQIHKIRFDEKNPYVITGGHFSQLYVRNLGIFYNALLDPRIPSSADDWTKRQTIALKTLALDLAIFQLAGKEFTTITSLRKNLFTGINIYARPSDSLFAILYTLCALTDENFIEKIFPAKASLKHQLQTKTTATKFLKEYKQILSTLIKTYYQEVINPETHLVRKNLLLASARDGIKRSSSFYDNVIAWATIRLAKKIGLYEISEEEIFQWKETIFTNFWDKEEGIFLDDLSQLSQKEKLFSADSFIVISTGFFDVQNKKDLQFLEQMITYVKRKKLDIPFPLHYSTIDIPEKLYRPVRHIAPSYMGKSIWSHWGMEYIKTLIYLGKINKKYLLEAKKHLQVYKQNIETYGGYPELYDTQGKILHTRLYRSVLHNGWVINYEQTKMLLENILSSQTTS